MTRQHPNYVGAPDSFFSDLGEYQSDAIDFQNAVSFQDLSGDWRKAFKERGESYEKINGLGGDFNRFTGYNPSTKAVSYGNFIKNYYDKQQGSPSDKMAKALQKLAKAKEAMEQGQIPGGEKGGESGGEGSAEEIELEDVDLRALDELGRLANVETFKVGGEYKKIKDPTGKREKRKMKDFSELDKVVPRDLMNHEKIVRLNLVEHNIRISLKQKRVLVRQDLFLLVDDSGSMYHKYHKVKAVLMKIRPGILTGEVRLHIGRFESKLYAQESITTIEKFDKMYKEFPSGSGGETDIDKAVKKAERHIGKLKWGDDTLEPFEKDVEIIILNDGHDELVGEPTAITHCLTLASENQTVKSFCIKSGGTYNKI